MAVESNGVVPKPTEYNTAIDAQPEQIPADDHCDAVSETSTVAYEHEPFETFQHKVAELMANKFGCNRASVRTEHIKGGAYNRVIGLEVRSLEPKRNSCLNWVQKLLRKLMGKPASQAYVVRMQRGDTGDMDCQVATLKMLHDARLPFLTPQVVHYDLSSDNVLEKAYMVQNRIPGKQVLQLLDTMNFEQKKTILHQVVLLVNRITSIEAAPGNMSAKYLTHPSIEAMHVDKIAASEEYEGSSTIKKSVDHLLEVIEMRRQCQIKDNFCFYDIWDGFTTICKSLQARGFLEGPSVLVHNDLQPYNLLAEIIDTSTVDITGVIDWDDAYFAPKVMALRSPFWLWTSGEDGTSDDHQLEKTAMVEPANENDRLLRRLFLEIASEEYKHFAFCPEAILARRMYHHLRSGIHSQWEAMPAEEIIREWNELHPEDHAKVGEGYFNTDGTMKEGAYEKCANWGDSDDESVEEDQEDGQEEDKELV